MLVMYSHYLSQQPALIITYMSAITTCISYISDTHYFCFLFLAFTAAANHVVVSKVVSCLRLRARAFFLPSPKRLARKISPTFQVFKVFRSIKETNNIYTPTSTHRTLLLVQITTFLHPHTHNARRYCPLCLITQAARCVLHPLKTHIQRSWRQ